MPKSTIKTACQTDKRRIARMLGAFEQMEDLLPLIHDAAIQIIDCCPVGGSDEMRIRSDQATSYALEIRYLVEYALLIASVERLRNEGESGRGASLLEIYERIVPAPVHADSIVEIREGQA